MRRAPERILAAHLADQIPNVLGNRRPSGLAMTDLPGPEEAEAFTVPGDHRLGLDDDEGGTPIGPNPGQPCPEKPISGGQPRPLRRALEDAKLVAQSEDLDLEGCSAAEGSPKGRDERCKHEGGRESTEEGQLPLYQSDRRPQIPQSSTHG